MFLKTRAKELDLSQKTHIMGILNVTPDSFSDGGKHLTPESAIAQAETMVEEGADIIDIGGESTRPGADPIPLNEELKRIVPVLKILAQRLPHVPLSIDTSKPEVAKQCLEEGASIINDITALSNPEMATVVRKHKVPVVLMHTQGTPRTMQKNPQYKNVVEDIKKFFSDRMDWAVRQGLRPEHFILDPGIGFGKTSDHNMEILRNTKSFLELEQPLLIGTSRKSFIGKILRSDKNPLKPEERLEGTLATHLWTSQLGAHILRVHDVLATRRALVMWKSLRGNNPNNKRLM